MRGELNGFQLYRRAGATQGEHRRVLRALHQREGHSADVREPRHAARPRHGLPRGGLRSHGPSRGARRHPLRHGHPGHAHRGVRAQRRLHRPLPQRHAGAARHGRLRQRRADQDVLRRLPGDGQAHLLAGLLRARRGLGQPEHDLRHPQAARRHLPAQRPEDLGHQRRELPARAPHRQGRGPVARQPRDVDVARAAGHPGPHHRAAAQDRPADHAVLRHVLRRRGASGTS